MSYLFENYYENVVNRIGFNTKLGLIQWLRSEAKNPESKYKGCYYKIEDTYKDKSGPFAVYGGCRYLLWIYSENVPNSDSFISAKNF